jgi:DNA-binding beta-propeller fold protein YncE
LAIDIPSAATDQLAHPTFEGSGKNGGYSPGDLASAYNLPAKGGSGQTIAIVIAFDNPNAESDLGVYRSQYGLPPCTTANGCFKKLNQKGEAGNYPISNALWALESSLDLDMASAICPECKITLVEANDNELSSLGAAEDKAAALAPAVISNSWGASEWGSETSEDIHYNHPGIPAMFSTGDFGYGTEYPAASKYVTAVGGTALRKDPSGTRGWTEEAWSGAGSGCSLYEGKPAWQKDTQCSKRMLADVAAVAAPETPVSVYDSYETIESWVLLGGTSASAPIMAGIEARASATTRAMGAQAFYNGVIPLFDITVGRNGTCTPPSEQEYLCTGELGYDGPTGDGTPGFTASGKPVVSARSANVTAYTGQLQGTVNPEGSSTQYTFEYGLTTAYGETAPIIEANVGAKTTKVSVSKLVTNLNPEQTYHYRLSATNSKGTTHGEDHTFGTAGPNWVPHPTYSSSVGSVGSGDGQMSNPYGVAVDPVNGTVAVADLGNSRIQVFNESGEFIRKFGSNGTNDGEFTAVEGVAFDQKGNIWSVDANSNRVQEFTETGKFIRKFGSKGSANGLFRSPQSIAIDAGGNVWVSDTTNNRVQKFNEGGVYQSQFAAGYQPTGVTVDANGNIWSVNSEGRVQEHDAGGTLLREFGESGYGGGKLWLPWGIAVDEGGNVWVANRNWTVSGTQFAEVDVFSQKGVFEGSFGSVGTGKEQFGYPDSLALDPRGNIWIADDANGRIDKWKVPSKWPPVYSSTFGSEGYADGQFIQPTGIAANPVNGKLVITDPATNQIHEFTSNGEFIRKFGSAGSGDGQFNQPFGVSLDSKGNIWIADVYNNRIQEFNEKGEFIRKFGTLGTANGYLKQPWGVAVDSKGNVWVADSNNVRVQEFSETGTYIRKFAAGAVDITVDSKDNVWTVSGPGKVEEHNGLGELVRSFGSEGSENGQLNSPRGISVDSNGNIWIADMNNNRIEVFSERGEYLTKFGSYGTGSGQFSWPNDVVVDPRGYAWVVDTFNHRISKWTW